MKVARIVCAVLLAACLMPFAAGALALVNLWTIPTRNTNATHFDTIIVLGFPAWDDGRPSPEQRERVLEGVREYKAGVAPRLIMTGGAAHNKFVEAQVMGRLAGEEGVPAAAIVEEPEAMNTIQNIVNSEQIMHDQGWRSAEVVSSSAHIPRAAMILISESNQHPELAIQWKTRKARWPSGYSFENKLYISSFEAIRCLLIRVAGLEYATELADRYKPA